MERRSTRAGHRWLRLAPLVALLVGARLIAKAVGLPEPAGLLVGLLLLSVWAAVSFVGAERRRERESARSAGRETQI